MTTRKSLIPILTTLPILSLDKPVNPENQRSKFVFGKNQELKRTLMHFLTSTRVCTTSMVSERSRKSAHSIINLTCRQLQISRCLSTLNSQSKLIVSWLHCKNQYPTLNSLYIEYVISMERGTVSSRQSFIGSSWLSANTFSCTSRLLGQDSQ